MSLRGHRKVSRPPSICLPPWAGGVAPHSGGRRGSSTRGDTRFRVPEVAGPLLILGDVPHNLNARRWLSDSRTECVCASSTALPEVSILEPHPLDGVLQAEPLPSMSWGAEAVPTPSAGATFALFLFWGKVRKTPLPGSSAHSSSPAGE